ncbi:unnamed protein product [marine sediment metagenome]|uniref:DUF1844 domain-containing protein n=1 Tax=marine sediment metagenome TaxID=412755 RepID=X0W512_9ZZZZ
MGENKKEEPKIVVDDDWKAQAQAEKQKLDERAEKQAQQDTGAQDPAARELPPATFATLVSSLATQVMLAMGGMQDPKTKRRIVDLALAKHHIDTLAMLEEKAKGNLTDEEAKLLDQALYQVRMHYVQVAQGGMQA